EASARTAPPPPPRRGRRRCARPRGRPWRCCCCCRSAAAAPRRLVQRTASRTAAATTSTSVSVCCRRPWSRTPPTATRGPTRGVRRTGGRGTCRSPIYRPAVPGDGLLLRARATHVRPAWLLLGRAVGRHLRRSLGRNLERRLARCHGGRILRAQPAHFFFHQQGAGSEDDEGDGSLAPVRAFHSRPLVRSGVQRFFRRHDIHLLEVLSHGRLKDAITPESIAQSSYHAWAAFLGGEDYEWVSWPGRCLRLGLLFLILIVISTYTANLAAFFTRPVYEIHGPTDLDTLKGAVACTIWSNDVAALEGFVSEVISPNHTWPHADRRQWCHDALKEGRAQAWFDDYAAHNSYQLKHCSALALVPAISLKPLVVGFAMSAANVSLVSSMSAALVHLEKQPAIRNLEQDLFGWGRVCPSDSELVSSTTPVSFQSLGGAFLISGALMLMSLVMAIATFALRSYQGAKYVAPDSATDGEMLRELLTKVAELERLYAGAEGTEPLPPSLQDDLSLSVMEVASVPVCPAPSSPQQSKERTPWTEGASER
ncbi:unnamed protein product, partial [Prorocentrum cordatum]